MKKILHLLVFSFFALNVWALEPSTNNSSPDVVCGVSIGIDSTATGDVALVAYPTGTAPFSYAWSNGEGTQSIIVTSLNINYCVTIADANGCTATTCLYNSSPCSVSIVNNPNSGLTAVPTGVAPFSFQWSNGTTGPTLIPNAPGAYCVYVADAAGCTATACFTWGNPSNCAVTVADSLTGAGWQLFANASGGAPYTYQWNNQNASTNNVFVSSPGSYCVTITTANGCTASDCITVGNNSCTVTIIEQTTNAGIGLHAVSSLPNAVLSYQWSTGELTPIIYPTSSNTYCVSVTGGGCIATACYNYVVPGNFNISGYLYFPDSINNPAPMQGTVELFYNSPNSNVWEPMGTVNIESNPAGWSNYYSFGQQTNAGNYMVKATLDPNSPAAADYLPTYHFNTVHWDEANLISLPSSGSGLYNIILDDGQNLTAGSGQINGTVTEGDGFTANGEGDRGGTPRPNTSVLLFDENEQPITHTLTDDQGKYSFGSLPFGTYKLEVEIVGIEQVERWVTLSDNNPIANGNDFQVTENGIVLDLREILAGSGLEIMPNPTTGILNLKLEASNNFKASFQLTRLDGTTVLVENQQVAKGNQRFSLDLSSLSAGFYILHVNTGNEVISAKVMKQ